MFASFALFILHPSALQYAELHAKTNFSFQEGASHPAELVERAAELGYAALAVTDRNSLAGVVRAHGAAKPLGLKLVLGAEITPVDALPVVLWAPDRAAYGRLARLITEGRRRAEKGVCRIVLDDLVRHAEGLLAGVCVADALRRAGEPGPLLRQLEPYRVIFGERCWLLAELHYGPDDARLAAQFVDLSRRARLALVAAGGVHYHVPQRAMLHDVLTAVRHRCTVDEARQHLFANAERHLQPLAAIAARFHFAPDAVQRTLEIAQRCSFSLDELRYEYPEELAPSGQTPDAYLAQLAWSGAEQRYPQGVPERIRGLLAHELALIEELHYAAYFLTVWDLVRFARSRGILCQGRGSAANSVVCYCLGITAVDPERLDVLFERFVSRERHEAPDIDVDFEHERREEVLQYIYEKYGRDRAGMTAEVISYRPRMAVRDVGRALGVPAERLDALAKNLEHFHADPDLPARCREVGIDPHTATGAQLLELSGELLGFPRHLSQHTGGMVITRGPLCELVPIENAAMADRTVIEWNKDDLDELGILKVDCLALGMLTAIRKTFDLVRTHYGRELTLATVPESDPAVYEMIRQADTMGVFQIESRAQMSMLPRLRPRCFYDLVIEVAIVRPGPIQGDMVHPYLRRRAGLESPTYPNDEIRAVLEKTLGVPLFQEQAMRLAVVAAGFTPGEADQLRRAMAAWRRPGLIDEFRQKLIRGMTAQGLTPEYAAAVFRQIRGFGEYGFPESHAASFALLVYVSAWLKCHLPAAFTAGLLNSQPLGFYAPAQLVRNAREHGVTVLPADVNHSAWDCTLEEERNCKMQSGNQAQQFAFCNPFSLRLGLRMLSGLAEAQARRIESTRQRGGPFHSLEDFVRRTGLGRAVAVRLAQAGAMDSLGLDRRGALWHALAQDTTPLPLLDQLEPRPDERPADLPALSAAEEVLADYRTAGLSLRAHPLSFLRAELAQRGVTPAGSLRDVADGQPVCVAGIVLVRQRPGTAKGITFVTLEDESGQANLIIRPDVWRRFRRAAIGATLLLAHGRLQRQHEVTHILVRRIEDFSAQLRELGRQSRDFH